MAVILEIHHRFILLVAGEELGIIVGRRRVRYIGAYLLQVGSLGCDFLPGLCRGSLRRVCRSHRGNAYYQDINEFFHDSRNQITFERSRSPVTEREINIMATTTGAPVASTWRQ